MNARSKKLSELFADKEIAANQANCEIQGISLDSRLVKPGDLYLCVAGYSNHGLEFVEQALNGGAVAVATESGSLDSYPQAAKILEKKNTPLVEVAHLKGQTGAIAARFYDEPSRFVKIIAVTGTDGKTSVCRFICDALQELGFASGYIGTLGWGQLDPLLPTDLTTPDSVTLQRMLATLKDAGVEVVALEASSHGIAEGRLDAVDVDVAVLTNFGRDHLDYHGTVENYRAAKLKLFQNKNLNAIVVNAKDDLGRVISNRDEGIDANVPCLSFQVQDEDVDAQEVSAQIVARQIELNAAGLSFELVDGENCIAIKSQLIGHFNVENLLACHGALRALGTAANDAARALAVVKPVIGRMETFSSGARPVVVVDYAHTPQALSSAIQAVRAHCRGKLWVVFGCGGDRDPGKRAPMGKAAEAADRIVVTDDNPRSEDPALIRQSIVDGFAQGTVFSDIADRRSAIRHAIYHASAGDMVLVAGKGHEDYQVIADQRLDYSDRTTVRELLLEAC